MPRAILPVTFGVKWPACIQCGACVAVCLQKEPFVTPFDTIAVETPCRIACMRCVDVCPTSAVIYQVVQSL
jgi:NAD-dependent dihydropyrimidine dehydrogenase PreA subunit